jgi:hypothetical protein
MTGIQRGDNWQINDRDAVIPDAATDNGGPNMRAAIRFENSPIPYPGSVPRATPRRDHKRKRYEAMLAQYGHPAPKDGTYDVVMINGFNDDRQRKDGTHHPHNAIDVLCAEGTPLVAPCRCMVLSKHDWPSGGHTVTLAAKSTRNGRWWHLYHAHLMYPSPLRLDALLSAGDFIGQAGQSGTDIPHLHQAVVQGRRGTADTGFPANQWETLVALHSIPYAKHDAIRRVENPASIVGWRELEILSIVSMLHAGLLPDDSIEGALRSEARESEDPVSAGRARVMLESFGDWAHEVAQARLARAPLLPPQWRPFPYEWSATEWPSEYFFGRELRVGA